MTTEYVLIQAIGLLGTILFFISFQCLKNKNVFRVQFLSYLFYTIHLLLLGAVTGGLSYIINAFRSLCLGSNWKFAHKIGMCVLICALQIAALIFTWSSWISILPVGANIAATVIGYTHNARKIRIAAIIINSPLWIVYDILVGSWAGILDETISEVSIIISIIRYGWKNLDRVEKE